MTDVDFDHHDSRYPISVYTVRKGQLTCLSDTTEAGVIMAIRTHREDGDLTDESVVGIRDREARQWLANPFNCVRKR